MQLFCANCQGLVEVLDGPNRAAGFCPRCGSNVSASQGSTLNSVDRTVVGSSEDSLDLESRNIGRFRVVSRIGRGGYGTVYQAYDSDLDRMVAVKVPRRKFATTKDRQRFLREARHASQLHHPAIVPIYDLGEFEGTPYIVSELVEGTSLNAVLSRERVSYRKAAEIVATAAEALECAHQVGVVHRDVKPSNILIDGDGRPRIMDFGLARNRDKDETLTMDGQILGTPAYMSPEQAEGDSHEVDHRADIYSLGVVLYELLSGERPFRGNVQMMVQQLLHDDPRNPRSLDNTIPLDLETICLKAIEKAPAARYQTAQELADDLRRWLRSEPIHARRIGPMGRTIRWCRRNPSLAAMTSVALLLLIAVAVGTTVSVMSLALERERLRDAKSRESEALKSANASSKEARRAFEHYYTLISDNRLLEDPDSQPLLREILGTAIDYCQRFLEQYGQRPEMSAEVAATSVRLAQLKLATGDSDAATTTMEEAATRLEGLLATQPTLEQLSPFSAGLFRYPRYVTRFGAVAPSNPQRSVDLMTRCVAIWDKLASQYPDVPNFAHDRAGMYYYLDISNRAARDMPAAARAISTSIEILERLVQKHPQSAWYKRELSEFYLASGDIFVFTGKLGQALARQKQAIDTDPSNARAYLRMAWGLANCPDPKLREPLRAIQLAEQATKLEPRNPTAWHTLGAAEYRAGQWKAARESFDKTMTLANGGEVADWYFAAMACWRLGEADRARELFQKAEAWKASHRVPSDYLDGVDNEAAQELGQTRAQRGPSKPKVSQKSPVSP
jgi:serine/threonine protein kinase/Tfp pilus assembly protein PilF